MKRFFSLQLLVFLSFISIADEGMWLVNMLNQLNIEQKGSVLTPEEIYSINQSSVKDAIVGLGDAERPFRFFCSSEFVSGQGLVFTNYHCAFDMIQNHTTIDNNYIDNGFWAANNAEELYAEGVTASVVMQIIDVSEQILPLYELPDFSWKQIQDSIRAVSNEIVASVQDTSHLKAHISPFFERNQYLMFVYQVFEDVRIVGAPPRTIGKFGGDTDNWMWPRHTGDFAVLRVYADSENKPTAYSPQNKPFTPGHFLPISLKGYEEGDFAFIMGFPGSTDRYKTSFGVDNLFKYGNTSIIAVGDIMLDVYKFYMNQNDSIRIKYAAKYDSMSNYWKYAIGQNKGIAALKVIAQKMQQEKDLLAWISQDSVRKATYDQLFENLENLYKNTGDVRYMWNVVNVGMLHAVDMLMFIYEWFEFMYIVDMQDPVETLLAKNDMIKRIDDFFKEYDVRVDRSQFIAMMHLMERKIPESMLPQYFNDAKKRKKPNYIAYANKLFEKSMFVDKEALLQFLENPTLKQFKKDPAVSVLQQTLGLYFQLQAHLQNEKIEEASRLHMQALHEFMPDSLFYPDANSTLRYTYGYISGYSPRDAVYYNHYTTFEGLFQKEIPFDDEFAIPSYLKDLYTSKKYDAYTNTQGELPLCFLTNNDITGGNSGSAVMNARGEIIGIAFDGNWESMSGDIIFENEYQRSISVDIRYVLFVIDVYAGASYLLDEMTIVR
ncbi:MAG: S46 family peptidase [Bacteroidales bacterium]|nr:S46 family peptidase [Bacteroidales bacterium]